MQTPHESVNVNAKRGLIAAVSGNPATSPGLVAVYDMSNDCRHPVLQSTYPTARIGHESGFSSDGRTFYATGTAQPGITAVDVTDPKDPHAIWHGNISSHGMSLSDDGNRGYLADTSGQMVIIDTSEIQARKRNPQVRELSRLTWNSATIPQNAIPFKRDGKPYVLEVDEYSGGSTTRGDRNPDAVGAARIIDISDETKPRVVSNLRLQVNQPAEHAAAANDPGALSPVQGYGAHYCNIPTPDDPLVVACSFIVSGLRVFDISNLIAPKEIAYFVAPTTAARFETGYQASNFAMSMPAFAPERREVWYSDGVTGFYAVRVAKNVWPTAGPKCLPRSLSVTKRGIGAVRIGRKRETVLRDAGKAAVEAGSRSLRFCVRRGGAVLATLDKGRVTSVFSTSKGHRVKGVRRGTKATRAARTLKRSAKVRSKLTVLYNGRVIAGVKKGRVRFLGAVDNTRARSAKELRKDLRRAGL